MTTMSSASRQILLLYGWTFLLVTTAEAVKPGESATLECHFSSVAITLLEWKKSDLGSDALVFFFRENRSYESYLNEKFRKRVKLSDPEMKNGDVSVILQNVTITDNGTYECSVLLGNTKRRKRAVELRKFFTLTVEESGQPGGDAEDGGKEQNVISRRRPGLVVISAIIAAIFIIIYKQQKHKKPSLSPPKAFDQPLANFPSSATNKPEFIVDNETSHKVPQSVSSLCRSQARINGEGAVQEL